jgi:hypothetical protein
VPKAGLWRIVFGVSIRFDSFGRSSDQRAEASSTNSEKPTGAKGRVVGNAHSRTDELAAVRNGGRERNVRPKVPSPLTGASTVQSSYIIQASTWPIAERTQT